MSNLIEHKKVDGIYNLKTLVDEKNLYPEFDSDFEEIIRVGKLYQIQEENEMLFADVLECVKLVHYNHPTPILATKLKNAIQSFLGNLSPFLNGLKQMCSNEFFTELTHTFYDLRLSYRFLYELRNISQHKAFIISLQNNINEKMKVVVYKSKLIDNFNITKNKILELFEELPEEIDLLPYLNEFFMVQSEMLEWVFVNTFELVKYKRFVDYICAFKHEDNSLFIQRNLKSRMGEDGKESLRMTLIFLEIPKYIDKMQLYHNSKLRLVKLGHKFDYINQFYFLTEKEEV